MSKIKNSAIQVAKMFGIFLITIIVFYILMCLAYLFPDSRIRANVEPARVNIAREGKRYNSFFAIENDISKALQLDNYTDAAILGTLANETEGKKNIFEKAVLNERYNVEPDGPLGSFEKTYTDNMKGNFYYTRYWMGTITILRPAFTFLSFQSIRYINIYLIAALLFSSLYLINKKLGLKYAFAFLYTMIATGIYVVPMSLQYIPVFIITFIGIDLLFIIYDNDKYKKYMPYLFMFLGMFTAYYDILTSPLLTFGMPFIFLLILKIREEDCSFKDLLLCSIKYGLIWAISFGMTFFLKWIIATIVLGENQISSAIDQFLYRVNLDEKEQYAILPTLHRNIKTFFNKFVILMTALIILIYVLAMLKMKKMNIKNVKKATILIMVALLPYAWYIVLTNHSYIHFWMTYRIQALTLMSVLTFVFCLRKEELENR